jgi:pullulanase/glycogen debranching enzyme
LKRAAVPTPSARPAAGDAAPAETIDLDPSRDRWGDIWSVFVPGLGAGTLYHFQADGPFDPERGQRFDGRARLIDPYAKALAGEFIFDEDGLLVPPRCVVIDDAFDWQGDRHLRRGLSDTVIYEMHVRGFTASPTSAAYSRTRTERGRRRMASTAQKTSCPPSKSGIGSRLKRPMFTEIIASISR